MRILFLGDYSCLHYNLAQGLKKLGHEAIVVSDGTGWRNFPRDITLKRKYGIFGGIIYILKILFLLPKFKGYDIVQIINPAFFDIKAHRIYPIFNYIKKHNKRVILSSSGNDYYWAYVNSFEKPLRYSDFNIGDVMRTNIDAVKQREEWIGTSKEELNKYVAEKCDGIVPCLYEYWVCYKDYYPSKTQFIPLPILNQENKICHSFDGKIVVFVGIDPKRNEYKGTDIMVDATKAVVKKYPDKIELKIAERVPYQEYVSMMNSSDVILDQLYSYTPAMNALIALSKGIIVVGGAEPENYQILNEDNLRPIINVEPTFESCFNALEQLVLHPENINKLKTQGIEFVKKHHNYNKVAEEYLLFYKKVLTE